MFSNQDIDYSLNRPCRCLSAVAPPSSSSKSPKHNNTSALGDDGDDDANDESNAWDDDDDFLGDASASLTSQKFLIGSATPSVSKLRDSADDDLDDAPDTHGHVGPVIVEEDDEDRINRLYLLQYHEDSHELTQDSSWAHPSGEIWSMACHPSKGDWVVTCGGGSVFSAAAMMDDIMEEDGGDDGGTKKKNVPLTHFQTTLWRIPDLGNEENDEDDYDFGETTRQRTESAASGMTSASSKLEAVVSIPHGASLSSSASSGWEQRVGQILWNPLLHPSQSSGDALYDLAETSSNEGGGNLLTIGWDDRSPISLWDISSLSVVKEVWSTHGGGEGVASSRRSRRFSRRTPMHAALPRRVSWDPNDTHCILATCGVDVVAYDMRCPANNNNNGMGVIRSAHRYGVADVCHNHLQSNVVVTSGMDGVMKFWDLRMHLSGVGSGAVSSVASGGGGSLGRTVMPPPLLKAVRGGHSHWMTRATYNPFHDQLVLSGGSDGIANLWRVSSCSSAPLLELDDDEVDGDDMGRGSFDDGDGAEGEKDEYANAGGDGGGYDDQEDWMDSKPKEDAEDDEYDKEESAKSTKNSETNAHDIRVTRFECSDVTADIAWSASDPWVYATLSYDGAIVVHHVPSKEKYKILL